MFSTLLTTQRGYHQADSLCVGHEIVATIAQIHLHPAVQKKLCTILPPEARCHLAPVAAWADQVRNRYPGTGPMHYVNGASLAARPYLSVSDHKIDKD